MPQLQQPRLDGLGGFQHTNNHDKTPSLSHTLQNGGSRWSSNIWECDKPDLGMGRGSGSLLSSSEVDPWDARRQSSTALNGSDVRRNSAFPSLQQAQAGQAPGADRYHINPLDSAFTSAGQNSSRHSPVDWQHRNGNHASSSFTSGRGPRPAPNGLSRLSDGLNNGIGLGQSNGSWAEDDSMFSPMDSRHNSSARASPGSIGVPAATNGLVSGGLRPLRNEVGPRPSPWQSNSTRQTSDRTGSTGNGFTLPGADSSSSVGDVPRNYNTEPDLAMSMSHISLSSLNGVSNAAARRQNSALGVSVGTRTTQARAQLAQYPRENGILPLRNTFDNRGLNGTAVNSVSNVRRSEPELFGNNQTMASEGSDFFPTYSADMARTSSSESRRSNHGVQLNGHGSLGTSFGNSIAFPSERGPAFTSRQEQQYFQYLQYQAHQQFLAMQMRNQLHDPYAYSLPYDGAVQGFNPYMPLPQFSDPRMVGFHQSRAPSDLEFDPGASLRSALLEDFKSNASGKGPKKFELRVSGDEKLETCIAVDL